MSHSLLLLLLLSSWSAAQLSPLMEQKRAESPRHIELLSRRSALDKNFMRFGRADSFMRFGRSNNGDNFMRFGRNNGDNFMRFGRGADSNFMRFGRGGDSNFMRFGRAKDSNFMRFGRGGDKGAANFMRFGRMNGGDASSNFMRFGRGPPEAADLERPANLERPSELVQANNFMRLGRPAGGNGDNFMRFGRGPDKFMRFGRENPDDSEVDSGESSKTSERRESIIEQHGPEMKPAPEQGGAEMRVERPEAWRDRRAIRSNMPVNATLERTGNWRLRRSVSPFDDSSEFPRDFANFGTWRERRALSPSEEVAK